MAPVAFAENYFLFSFQKKENKDHQVGGYHIVTFYRGYMFRQMYRLEITKNYGYIVKKSN